MATALPNVEKQRAPIKVEPKFDVGYEFYSCSSIFGKRWAQKKFGDDFNSYYLIGTVKKVNITKKKIVEYRVHFAYDRQTLIYDENLLDRQVPKTNLIEIEKLEKTYAVFKAAAIKKSLHGKFDDRRTSKTFGERLLAVEMKTGKELQGDLAPKEIDKRQSGCMELPILGTDEAGMAEKVMEEKEEKRSSGGEDNDDDGEEKDEDFEEFDENDDVEDESQLSGDSNFEPEEGEESADSEERVFIKTPSKRRKGKRRKVKSVVSSDEEENSDDEKLRKKGNPLEQSTEHTTEKENGGFEWTKVAKQVKFPWVNGDTEILDRGMRHLKKTDFYKKNPFQLLLMMVPLEWFEQITEETNRYAQTKIEGKRFEKVKITEIVTFHALLIGMTLHPLPNKEHYWRSGTIGTITFPNYGKWMSKNRFKAIKRFLHLRSNEKRDELPKNSGAYKLWQTEPFINLLRKNFKKLYYPGKVVTVDERMIPIRNRMCPIRVYNRSKPYKFGMELFTICDSVTFYCYDFLVYDKVPQVGLHTKVVLDLCKGLPNGEHYDIILDRGFTSPLLLEELKKQGHVATGTVMANRKFLPKKKHGFELDKKADQGKYVAFVCPAKEMIALQWMDKRPVLFLSTSKGLESKALQRRQYSANGSFISKEVVCPEVCAHYNAYKDSVDQFDKHCLRGNYSLEKSQVSRKWWLKLYWGLFDSAIVNSWILWKLGHEDDDKFEFMTSMQDSMLSYIHPKERGGEVKTRKSTLLPTPNANRQVGCHAPEKMKGRLICVFCRAMVQSDRLQEARDGGLAEYKKPPRTSFKCDTCNVPLCVRHYAGEKNCFRLYHKEKNIQGIDYNIIRRISKKK